MEKQNPEIKKFFKKEGKSLRLDLFLAQRLRSFGYSRTLLAKAITAGKIKVDDKIVKKADFTLKNGMAVELIEDLLLEASIKAKGCKSFTYELPIIHQDEAIVVINKPPDILTHQARSSTSCTVVDILISMDVKLAPYGAPDRTGVVHRLDKDTSGVIVLAKTAAAYLNLVSQFKKRIVKKRYIAVVKGIFPSAEGVIDVPIGRHMIKRHDMSVRYIGGKTAVTSYKVIEIFKKNNASMVYTWPATGRTHQIRVHMAHIMHPILGDEKYHEKSALIARQALHAETISFIHPCIEKTVTYQAPLADDIKQLVKLLK